MRIIILLVLMLSAKLSALNYLGPVAGDVGPIDVVYTWVDGDDPEWQRAKGEAYKSYPKDDPVAPVSANRFRNRNELKYSLRSLNKYAPFVNHIYIVTFGQRPKWLKPDPKVTIVDHQEIFFDASDLPTFNSQAIEANLHHIPNLSERFIYFNDDFFLGCDVQESNFYDAEGKIKVSFSSWTTPTGSVLPTDSAFSASWKTTNRFLDALFGPAERKAVKHSPYVLRKSLMTKLDAHFTPLFKKVSSHKFRKIRDYVLTNGLIQYIALQEQHAVKAKLKNVTVRFGDNVKENQKRLNKVAKQRPHTFCIQDVGENSNDKLDKQLQAFFDNYFPESAPWEY